MRPVKGSKVINIPITFDNVGGGGNRGANVWFGASAVLVVWFFSSLFVFIGSDTMFAWVYPFLSFFVASYILRFIVFRERYYKKKRKELVDSDFMFDHNIFWNIYEISDKYPYMASFGNGMKGLFFAFDKDVIVGKDSDFDFYHHEAIARAYAEAPKMGIELMHIDYMDIVGKDERMASLFTQAEQAENEDIRKVVLRMYDYINFRMNKTFATYDIYCLYSFKRDEHFWDDAQNVLTELGKANYIRYRALNRTEITPLVESLMNISEFSVNRANDTMFKEMNKLNNFITTVWVENSGQRTILNKTSEELEEDKRVRNAERKVKRKSKNRWWSRKKASVEEEIDL